MTIKFIRQALATAALAAVLPMQAHAYTVVNTQVPTNGLIMSNTIDSGNWLAEKFSISTASQIDSVMAYVLSADTFGDAGKNFTIALYANNGANLPALNFAAASQGQLFQATATYTADGWNGVSNLNWSVGPGSYWLALEAGSDATSVSYLQAPSGALPVAQAVAFYSGSQQYAATGLSDSFGLQITATAAVPEPSSLALMLASLAIMGVALQRRAR